MSSAYTLPHQILEVPYWAHWLVKAFPGRPATTRTGNPRSGASQHATDESRSAQWCRVSAPTLV